MGVEEATEGLLDCLLKAPAAAEASATQQRLAQCQEARFYAAHPLAKTASLTPARAAICCYSASRILSVVQGSLTMGSPSAKCKAAGDGWMAIGEGERKGGETERHTQLAGAHLQLLGGLFPLIKHLAVLPVL